MTDTATTDTATNRSNILVMSLVVAVVFQVFLSVMILRELRTLQAKVSPGGAQAAEQQGLEPGSEAPGFRLADSEGSEVSLDDYGDRPVMLVFSSDECRFCKEMYPQLKRFRESEEAAGVEVVMLQIGSTPEQNRALTQAQGFDFPILVADPETFSAYRVPGTPFATFVHQGLVTGSGVTTSYEQMAGLLGSAVAN